MSSTCKHCGRQRVGCQCPVEIEPKPLDPRHAHLALMAATILSGFLACGDRSVMADVVVNMAKRTLAEVEAQDGK